jgi:hypothetical protein
MADSDPADRLELHLAREFVRDYLHKALRGARAVEVNPNAILWAAKFRGLRFSLATLERVISEFSTTRT